MTGDQQSYLSGKEKAKRERRLVQVENEISVLEEKISRLKLKFSDTEIATDYQQLSELQDNIMKEEQILNDLLIEWSGLV